jgi:hypothetical protein
MGPVLWNALRTVRDLSCILPEARNVRPGLRRRRYGHVNEFGLEIFKHQGVVVAALAIGPRHIVRLSPVVDSDTIAALLLHDRPAVLGGRWD